MMQHQSASYFEQFFQLAAPTIQHQVISLIRPFFPLEEQQQVRNLSPLYRQLIGMITALVLREELIIKELQKQNLEHHKLQELLRYVKAYRAVKSGQRAHLVEVFEETNTKTNSASVVHSLRQSLSDLLQAKYILDRTYKLDMENFHDRQQLTLTDTVNRYAQANSLRFNSQNPELANLYGEIHGWLEAPAPTIEQLLRTGINLPIPKPNDNVSDEQRIQAIAEVKKVVEARDLTGLGIKLHHKIAAIFQDANGNKISGQQTCKMANHFLAAAGKDKAECQTIIDDYTKANQLIVTDIEKVEKLLKNLSSLGSQPNMKPTLKSPAPSAVFPTVTTEDKESAVEAPAKQTVGNWPPRLTPRSDPTKF